MATWQNVPLPVEVRLQIGDLAEGFQLLNDGRVLIIGSIGSVIMSPDEYGSYRNPTFGPVALFPGGGTSYGGPSILHPDGRVSKWGGHLGVDDPYQDTIWVFNPATNSWVNAGSAPNAGHQMGNQPIMLDNGVATRPRGGGEVRLDTNTLQVSVLTNTTVTQRMIDWLLTNGIQQVPALFGYPEGSFTRTPTDTFVQFSTSFVLWIGFNRPELFINLYRPSANSGEFDVTRHPRPTNHPARVLHRGVTTRLNGQGYVDATSYNSIDSELSWMSIQSDFNSALTFEVGANIWWPRLGRVVIVGGATGELWAYDPVNETLDIVSQMPQVEGSPNPHADFLQWGNIHPDHFGQTLHELLASQTIRCVANKLLGSYLPLVIELTNGQFVFIVGQGQVTVTGGSVGLIPAGATVNYGGPFQVRMGPRTDDPAAGVVPVNAKVWARTPTRSSAEALSVILPNGNLMVGPSMAGSTFATVPSGQWAEFDGTTWTYFDAPVHSNDDYQGSVCLLPNGEVMILGGVGMWFRSAPPTRDLNNRPEVVNIPSRFMPGHSFTLTGRQLMGRHIGTTHGDDKCGHCNHPLVRLTNNLTGRVYYAATTNYSTYSIAPNLESTCTVTVPESLPLGGYTLHVISAGNESLPVQVAVEGMAVGTVSSSMMQVWW